jgi:putative iron-regulated protein
MRRITILFSILITVHSCTKEPEPKEVDETINLNKTILEDFASIVAEPIYDDLAAQTSLLDEHVHQLQINTNNENLLLCKQDWLNARRVWEMSEAFLFGPVSTNNIDPRIDTWPINFQDLEGELSSSNAFTETYVDQMQDALKGFHPIEYFIFGENGNKDASEFTARELEYLVALSNNLKALTQELSFAWKHSTATSFHHEFILAGVSSTVYPTQLSAYEEVVNSMIGICEEVADGKIGEPFINANPALEESPFSSNSLVDFSNNIIGIENVYLGKYNSNEHGLEDLVRKNNLQLDGEIKSHLQSAIAALNAITVPFGEAIFEQPVQVQNAIDAIHGLKEVLENQLKPYVMTQIN